MRRRSEMILTDPQERILLGLFEPGAAKVFTEKR